MTFSSPIKHLIIDTDVGLDDMFALMMLFLRQVTVGDLSVEIITTVKGLQLDTDHAATIIQRCINHIFGTDQSHAKPLVLSGGGHKRLTQHGGHCFSNLPFFHHEGYSTLTHGMADVLGFPNSSIESCFEDEDTFDERVLREVTSKPQCYYTLVTLGPLSNVARWILKDSTILDRFDSILLMAGCVYRKGYTGLAEAAEMNIKVDAEAARIVFEQGFGRMQNSHQRVVMMGLDVANGRVIARDKQKSMAQRARQRLNQVSLPHSIEHKIRDVMIRLMELHWDACTFDPVATSWLIVPHLFKLEQNWIRVETDTVEGKEGFIVIRTEGQNDDDDKYCHVSFGVSLDQEAYARFVAHTCLSVQASDF